MGRDSDRIYNIITMIALILTFFVIIGVIAMMGKPPLAPQVAMPTAFITLTPSPVTPTNTFTPTRTPLPPTFTLTPTETLTPLPSATATASITPSPTITDTPAPTLTASITFTPSASPTEPPTATPTGPTPTFAPTVNPYPFDLREPVTYTSNFANSFGCAWQGTGGSVIDLNGNQFSGLMQVRAFDGSGLDRVINIGSNSMYGGTAGWELKVSDSINTQIYFVQLESSIGVQQSPRIQVQFPSDCARNVAIVNFIQIRSLQQP